MEILSREQVGGSTVTLKAAHPDHFSDSGRLAKSQNRDISQSFADVLFSAVDQVNASQINADQLEEKMMLYPDQVDIHEVMIASEKARLSVSFFKSISEKAIRAYNEIMMLR